MRIGDPLDPALQAASLALNGRAEHPSSRFASIELRGQTRQLSNLAPIGYVFSVGAALALIFLLWTL